jgi:L-idonate 5-dehydrogenase
LRIDTLPDAVPGAREVRVRMERGGICGSDLHYFHDGRIGTIVVREPMVLGHEASGIVDAVGAEVTRVAVGCRIAINPSRACGRCRYCQEGKQMHCLDMRFYGSAMRFPHVQGAFREAMIVDEAQCHPMPETATAGEAAMCEPLAVCLHAVRRAGQLLGKRVLVTGCGPIGALCVVAARQAGALEIVATDVAETPFKTVLALGASRTVNVAGDPDALRAWSADKGTFDVLLECSGNEKALVGAFEALRPQGIIVQVGLGGSFTLPINTIVAKEFELRGTFRFHEEFALASDLIAARRVDVRPLITATMPFAEAREAFMLASDRSRSLKVQLAFG